MWQENRITHWPSNGRYREGKCGGMWSRDGDHGHQFHGFAGIEWKVNIYTRPMF